MSKPHRATANMYPVVAGPNFTPTVAVTNAVPTLKGDHRNESAPPQSDAAAMRSTSR